MHERNENGDISGSVDFSGIRLPIKICVPEDYFVSDKILKALGLTQKDMIDNDPANLEEQSVTTEIDLLAKSTFASLSAKTGLNPEGYLIVAWNFDRRHTKFMCTDTQSIPKLIEQTIESYNWQSPEAQTELRRLKQFAISYAIEALAAGDFPAAIHTIDIVSKEGILNNPAVMEILKRLAENNISNGIIIAKEIGKREDLRAHPIHKTGPGFYHQTI